MINGITLIVLVITIIVLLILAGVSISTLGGGDTTVEKATEARDNWNEKHNKDEQKMNEITQMNKKMNPITE